MPSRRSWQLATFDMEQTALQADVLDVAAAMFPGILQALAADVLPIYRRDVGRLLDRPVLRFDALLSSGRFAALEQGLRDWGASFHLTDLWVFDTALPTMRAWALRPRTSRSRWTHPPIVRHRTAPGRHDVEADPAFMAEMKGRPAVVKELAIAAVRHVPDFDPALFTEKSHQRHVEAHRDYMNEIAKGHGLAARQAKRHKTPARAGDHHVHVEWLLAFQVGGQTYASIAREYLPPSSEHGTRTVRAAVRALAARINLTLRKASPGRPRKHR